MMNRKIKHLKKFPYSELKLSYTSLKNVKDNILLGVVGKILIVFGSFVPTLTKPSLQQLPFVTGAVWQLV